MTERRCLVALTLAGVASMTRPADTLLSMTYERRQSYPNARVLLVYVLASLLVFCLSRVCMYDTVFDC